MAFTAAARSSFLPDHKRARRDDHQHRYDSSSSSSSDEECSRGQFTGHFGAVLHHGRFEYVGDLGKGTFGKVIACHDRRTGQRVAIKVVRSVPRYLENAREEADILQRVNAAAADDSKIVWLLTSFSMDDHRHQQQHECLVFEQLGCSLLTAQERNGFRGFALAVTRHIIRDILLGLRFLHDSVGLVHTDLKMENVLFVRREVAEMDLTSGAAFDVDYCTRWFSVKLIDFGNATYLRDLDQQKPSSSSSASPAVVVVINTRQYRAPEVILELPWDQSSDVFGVGCIALELHRGEVLFSSNSVSQHLAMMERLHDGHRFPERLVRRSPVGSELFSRHDERVVQHGQREREEVRQMRSLRELVFGGGDVAAAAAAAQDVEGFYRLAQGMLNLDPERRITARHALQHRWFRDYYY